MSRSLFAMKLLCDTPRKEEILFRQLALPKRLAEILDVLKKDSHAQIFLNKVSKKDAPNYYDVIKEPMDLGTVGRKLHLYRGLDDFKCDLDLIWSNCLKYNTAEYFIDCATEMQSVADSLINIRGRVYPAMLEDAVYEGTPVVRGREKLKHSIARCLSLAGFQKIEKSIIGIVADVLEHRMCREIKRIAEARDMQ